jgi:hypothetical protein
VTRVSSPVGYDGELFVLSKWHAIGPTPAVVQILYGSSFSECVIRRVLPVPNNSFEYAL